MSEMTIATLKRMDLRGTLEVEHLLRMARNVSPGLADALDELAINRGWPLAPCFPEVPMGTWVQVVCVYCREGYAGLLAAASDPEMLVFVLGLLNDLGTEESMRTVFRLARSEHKRLLANPQQAVDVAGALNFTAMNCPKYPPCESERIDARDFLHDAFLLVTDDSQLGLILCALRFFGDETSLLAISTCPPLPPHWESAKIAAVRAIRKRTKRPTASTNAA